jgi:phosphoribosylaminoimidazole-succinocarboxamide synthase
MDYDVKLAEGKTKIVYAHPTEPALVVLVHKDAISAGDGARRNEITGKGELSGRTAANVFRFLNQAGVPTHFVDAPSATEMVARGCEMIPIEVVMRRRATGSYLRRYPQTAVEQGIATAAEVAALVEQGRHVFGLLEQAWAAQDVALIDLKIEFGRDRSGNLLVADMIDNDSWRIWPGGEKERMLDKQIYRNMQAVTDQGLDALKQKYAEVAELTERFVGS